MFFADVQSIRELVDRARDSDVDLDDLIEALDAAADRIEELESDVEWLEEDELE